MPKKQGLGCLPVPYAHGCAIDVGYVRLRVKTLLVTRQQARAAMHDGAAYFEVVSLGAEATDLLNV